MRLLSLTKACVPRRVAREWSVLGSRNIDGQTGRSNERERMSQEFRGFETPGAAVPRTNVINRGRVRCQRFGAAARREEEEYRSWIFDRRATRQQRQRSATLRAKLWRASGHVAPQSQNASAMLLRRALPATRQSSAHSFPIYEIGSNHSP
jgi:hypothetical protein